MTNFRIFCSWVLGLIVFAFSDNLSAENSKSSADFSVQLIQLLECMFSTDPGLYGEASGVFFEAFLFQAVFMHSVKRSFEPFILWSFPAETVTTDRQMQNLDRLCNGSLLILRKLETIVLIEEPTPSTGTAIILVSVLFLSRWWR